ncbi:hypothetical protein CBR_g23169 [Chara braunii]|uniref:Alpha-mannosidase n=1 Tax=Chara braunii TaxID=69332 RepID=A0A388JV10_CHABU|nr:hypothetical protein CBR_g23169 [Chara braunii]|eukprot:GBG61654.1 hypothetical protein CBR_g23169 [Chara braunii]
MGGIIICGKMCSLGTEVRLTAISVIVQAAVWLLLMRGGVNAARHMEYNTTSHPVQHQINAHLVCHTHDDVGWLKTVDQYYVGSNNSIQVAAVQYILDSVLKSLLQNCDRKFMYVEQAFFQRWWREQNHHMQSLVRRLVDRGQLEFLNGGWCMHDEASTHYVDMVDQTTLGHRYIKSQFDAVPRIGWQIDPFGHSSVQASLLSAEAGLDAVFFARADYQDIENRRKQKSMEVIWRGSKSLGATAQTFAGILHHHYDPPKGFNFEINSKDPPLQDDPELFDYNVQERVDLFVEKVLEQASQFRTNHVMLTMGEDFTYGNANTWFKQLDKLIHYVNLDGRVNVFYSSPSSYVDAKNAANVSWPLKTDDYFPHANSPHSYWTGYFASRTALKGYVRSLSGYLQAARQLEFLLGRHQSGTTQPLEEALAIAQHHDAVSGTEKQHVANDFAKRLAIGEAEAEKVVSMALLELLALQDQTDGRRTMLEGSVRGRSDSGGGGIPLLPVVCQCRLLNITYCPVTEAKILKETAIVIILYNPLAWHRTEVVRFPVTSTDVHVEDLHGIEVLSQMVPVEVEEEALREFHAEAYTGAKLHRRDPLFELVFEAQVPPLGVATYFVDHPTNPSDRASVSAMEQLDTNASASGIVDVGNDYVRVSIANDTGRLQRITELKSGLSVELKNSFLWYNGSTGNTVEEPGQASGAYIFRPNGSAALPVGGENASVKTTIVRGPIVTEIRQRFSSWVSQVMRIYRGKEHVEVEYTVGPIPIDDGLGKEAITRFSTGLASNKTFYTDSNGRDMIRRVINYRPTWDLNVTEPVAGNYYPVNSAIYLGNGNADFSILVDRALGGASLTDGELELMLHRRLLVDDRRGVGECLNETVCAGSVCRGLTVRGKLYLNLNPSGAAARWRRTEAQKLYSPLLPGFLIADSDIVGQLKASAGPLARGFSALASEDGTVHEFPCNVALMTLQGLPKRKVLLRLAHLYEVDEDAENSNCTIIDISPIVRNRQGTANVKWMHETTLTANQVKRGRRTLSWRVEGEEGGTPMTVRRGGGGEETFAKKGNKKYDFRMELCPMEIRSFEMKLKHRPLAERR